MKKRILHTLDRHEKIGPASNMELLVQRIENIIRVIDELFRIMEIENEKQKKRALVRLQGPNGNTREEYVSFDNLLNPETVKSVLKERESKLY